MYNYNVYMCVQNGNDHCFVMCVQLIQKHMYMIKVILHFVCNTSTLKAYIWNIIVLHLLKLLILTYKHFVYWCICISI